MDPAQSALSFETPEQLEQWLRDNHDSAQELWVRIFKKGSGTPSVAWADCVIACLIWGWIDGQSKPIDARCYMQRLTPRRARSSWSKRNTEHVARLIAEGRMQPPGLAQVEAARQDGRWDAAYAGSADMVIPDDFLAALAHNPAAQARFDTLKRAELYRIYHNLHSAKRAETRTRRMDAIIAKLERGEAP